MLFRLRLWVVSKKEKEKKGGGMRLIEWCAVRTKSDLNRRNRVIAVEVRRWVKRWVGRYLHLPGVCTRLGLTGAEASLSTMTFFWNPWAAWQAWQGAQATSPPALPDLGGRGEDRRVESPTFWIRFSEASWATALGAPKASPFCVVLLALIGRPGWFSDCVFLAVSRSTASPPVLFSSPSFDHETSPSHNPLLVCCSLDHP